MISKVAVLALFVSFASAGLYDGIGYSSQSIHYAPAPVAKVAYAPVHTQILHSAPVAKIAYSSPIVHAAPVLHSQVLHAAPVAKYAYAAPVAKLAYAAPVAKVAYAQKQLIDYVDPHPEYKFEYGVHDAHTGDVHSQSEERKGDVVHGSYSLIEPDGSKRIVEYTADPHNGFNAVVHREHNAHPVQKVIAAPVAKIAYAAPVAKLAYAAPVAKLAYAPAISYGYGHH